MVAITGVRTVLCETPLSRPLGDANNPSSQRNARIMPLSLWLRPDLALSRRSSHAKGPALGGLRRDRVQGVTEVTPHL